MSEALVLRESWGGAAERGLQARNERNAIIKSVLVEGVDFGVIPGTKDATLLKAGAEKIVDSLNLYPDYERMGFMEDWERPLFHYTYRCVLRVRGSDATIATGIGSCNSMESRYRWRQQSRACPQCGQETIIKGKEEYGGGWLCFAKKGGCGAKYGEKDQAITGQKVGQIPNDDIYSLVNTIDKMGQKRSLVAATLNLGFSDKFTQDIEDNPGTFGGREEDSENPAPREAPAPRAASSRVVSRDQGMPPIWSGKFVRCDTKDGQKGGRPWKLYTFVGADGEKFGTFDAGIYDGLMKLDGKEVEIVYSATDRGNKNIEEYRAL